MDKEIVDRADTLKRQKTILAKLEGMTLAEVSAEVLLRARRHTARAWRRLVDDADKTYVTDGELAEALDNTSLAATVARLRDPDAPRLSAGLVNLQRTAALVKQKFPESLGQTVCEADDIVRHRIPLFGRPIDFGEHLDWHTDREAGVGWQRTHYTRVPVVQGRLADARVVWELNRLHHLTTLGRAYALTQDERYAAAFIEQLTSWCEANPPRFGINWTVAMEAGIRAVNLLLAFDLLRASPQITQPVVELLLKTLLAHGRFIRRNLEFSYRIRSNHYLADLIGLFAIGARIPEFTESRDWATFAAGELLGELQTQVLADGVDDEASIAYHRLVLEMFTLFFTLGKSAEMALSASAWRRLEAMFAFVRSYLKPDFSAPVIGDSDDGRLLKFKERPPTDHRYLLSIAAVLFEKPQFKLTADFDEEALWWFGEAGLSSFERLAVSQQQPASAGFPKAQIYIQRRDSLYAIIDGGDNGLGGRGSHAHSDALSFELFAYNQTFLRDPGTYVYTTSKRWRQLFRSTAYHNTVRVDRREINDIRVEQPFWAGANVRPKINDWLSTAERDIFDGEHDAYTRLAEPVTHRRRLTFEKRDGYWRLEDLFTGAGTHLFEIGFHFDAGLRVTLEDGNRVIACNDTYALAIVPLTSHSFVIKQARRWVSPSYRTRLRSSAIIYHLRAAVPLHSVMLLIPYSLGDGGQESGVGKVDRLYGDKKLS